MAVNKVVYGDKTLVDLTNDSVTPDTLAEGATAHDASGAQITGTMKSGGGGSSVQSDWNQTDSSAADFIKNKPFGEFLTVLYEGTNLSPEENEGVYVLELPTFEIVDNQSYSVIIDGEGYAVTSILFTGMLNLIGNPTVIGGEDNGLPFSCFPNLDTGEGMLFISFIPFTSVYISTDAIKKIEQKYITEAVREFYIASASDSRYLYIDSYLTTKATKEDVLNTQYYYCSAVYNGIVTQHYAPAAWTTVDSYAEVRLVGVAETYYTAEYTE